jgi:quercetin dioxygenase-like cupin family protein
VTDDAFFIPELASLVAEAPTDSIVSRSVFSDGHVRATIFAFAKGQELTEHTAASPAVLHILSGEAELTLGRKSSQGRPGSWAYMPAHLPHSVRALTPLVMLLLLLKDGD